MNHSLNTQPSTPHLFKDSLVENNELIAMFMGYKITPVFSHITLAMKEGGDWFSVADKHYYEWNRQIPVWSKVVNTMEGNAMRSESYSQERTMWVETEKKYAKAIKDDNVIDGFNIIVTAIKFLNEQKVVK